MPLSDLTSQETLAVIHSRSDGMSSGRVERPGDEAVVEEDRVGDQAHRDAVVGQRSDVDLDDIADAELALLDDG